ncbi:MAG: hypothetical protein QOE03_2121 [Micromonosporaceae bacterium]|nr:hypothetical protein [Micromonosporaceae bacterium]
MCIGVPGGEIGIRARTEISERSAGRSQAGHHAASMDNGVVKWGSPSATSRIPGSLYLSAKPAFLGGPPFPVFEPGQADWGGANRFRAPRPVCHQS